MCQIVYIITNIPIIYRMTTWDAEYIFFQEKSQLNESLSL